MQLWLIVDSMASMRCTRSSCLVATGCSCVRLLQPPVCHPCQQHNAKPHLSIFPHVCGRQGLRGLLQYAVKLALHSLFVLRCIPLLPWTCFLGVSPCTAWLCITPPLFQEPDQCSLISPVLLTCSTGPSFCCKAAENARVHY